MRELPILFSGAMVRAILDGRKTQTRRVLKCRYHSMEERDDGRMWPWRENLDRAEDYWYPCPYGNPGDRLWVRETWQGPLVDDLEAYHDDPDEFKSPAYCEYAADGGAAPEFTTLDDQLVQRWRRSIHMPRWASRILLEVTDVRVERLQSISEADAIAEGIDGPACAAAVGTAPSRQTLLPVAVHGYAHLWESLNADRGYGWDTNPWVWVVSFKRVTA